MFSSRHRHLHLLRNRLTSWPPSNALAQVFGFSCRTLSPATGAHDFSTKKGPSKGNTLPLTGSLGYPDVQTSDRRRFVWARHPMDSARRCCGEDIEFIELAYPKGIQKDGLFKRDYARTCRHLQSVVYSLNVGRHYTSSER